MTRRIFDTVIELVGAALIVAGVAASLSVELGAIVAGLMLVLAANRPPAGADDELDQGEQ